MHPRAHAEWHCKRLFRPQDCTFSAYTNCPVQKAALEGLVCILPISPNPLSFWGLRVLVP
jgi:hypothetical protein